MSCRKEGSTHVGNVRVLDLPPPVGDYFAKFRVVGWRAYSRVRIVGDGTAKRVGLLIPEEAFADVDS